MSDPEQWQVSGNAPQAYERYMVPTLFTPWRTTPGPRRPGRWGTCAGCRLWTGIVARLAAQRVGPSGYVMGRDLNAAMIETARTQTPPAGAPVEWREGDAHALPCADATFDVVCCQQGLQFFPDKPHALREMHRVSGPGGRLVLSVCAPSRIIRMAGRWRTPGSAISVPPPALEVARRMALANGAPPDPPHGGGLSGHPHPHRRPDDTASRPPNSLRASSPRRPWRARWRRSMPLHRWPYATTSWRPSARILTMRASRYQLKPISRWPGESMRRHEKAPQRAQRTGGLRNGAPLSGLTAHFRPFASGVQYGMRTRRSALKTWYADAQVHFVV